MIPIILHTDLLTSLQPTGVETFLRRLVCGLVKYRTGAFQYWTWMGGRVVPLDEDTQVSLFPHHRKRWSYFFPAWEYPAWSNLPPKLKNALVFEPHYFIHQRKNPAVSYIHDLSCIDRFKDHPWYRVLKHRIYLPEILERAVAIMVHTHFIRDRICYHWPQISSKKIHVIPGGIECDEMRPILQTHRKKSILIVSTQEPRKGVADVFHVLTDFLDKHVQWEVLMVGKSGWKAPIYQPHPRVKYLGYVPQNDLDGLLGECGVLLYPSFYEGFGLPVLEALSARCPCIIRDIPALSEWVPHTVSRFQTSADLSAILDKGAQDGFLVSAFPQKFLLKSSIQRFEECFSKIIHNLA